MIEEKSNHLNLLKFSKLEKLKGILHFTSSRSGGQSQGLYASLNLSLKVEDNDMLVTQNRKLLSRTLKISDENLFFPDQCHTNHVKEVDHNTSPADLSETDALITQTKGICLCILTADCVPVLLYDPQEKVIAAIHAGWRGTAGRIVARTIESMVKSFSTKPENIIAAIGPAISQERYEVGDEVAEDLKVFFHDQPSIVIMNPKSGKYHIDLKKANKELLLRYGVKNKNIEVSSYCTFHDKDLFFSARRDGIHCGRFGTGIILV